MSVASKFVVRRAKLCGSYCKINSRYELNCYLNQVHVNGLVSFGQPVLNSQPQPIPTGTNDVFICPFWADIDLSYGPGKIYQQEYTRITDDVTIDPQIGSHQYVFNLAQHYAQDIVGDTGFVPTSVNVITWQAVSPSPASSSESLAEVTWQFFYGVDRLRVNRQVFDYRTCRQLPALK